MTPTIIRYQGREYIATGKTGTRRDNGRRAAEYRCNDRRIDARVWRDETGEIYED